MNRAATYGARLRRPLRFRYWRGVRYAAPHKPAPAAFVRCGSCGRAWDDDKPTELTPAPGARCPFEHWHRKEPS